MFRRGKVYKFKTDNVIETTFQNTPKCPSDVNLNAECVGKSEKSGHFLKSFEGLLYTAIGTCIFSLMYVIAKRMTYVSLGEQSMIYNIGNVVFNFPVLFYHLGKAFSTTRKDAFILIFRAVFLALALYTRFIAFRYLPLAEAAIIMSAVPALTSTAAYFFLKEPCSYAQVVALFITMIGMLISVRIPELLKNRSNTEFDSDYIIGLGSGVINILLMTFVHVSLRKMKGVHFSVIIFFSGCTGTVINAMIAVAFESFSLPRCGWDTLEMALIGVLGYLGNMSLVVAFQKDTASNVAVIHCASDIIISMIFQAIFFNQVPDLYVCVGAMLVLASISVISIRNWLMSLPDSSSLRKKLRYLWI